MLPLSRFVGLVSSVLTVCIFSSVSAALRGDGHSKALFTYQAGCKKKPASARIKRRIAPEVGCYVV